MTTLPLWPALTGSASTVGVVCFDSCAPAITAAQPLSGAEIWGIGEVFGVLLVFPGIIALVAVAFAVWARRRYHDNLARCLVIVAFLVFQVFYAFETYSLIPLACLAIGAFVWSAVLAQVARQGAPPGAQSAPAPSC